jgi:hypothetical protein
MHTLTEIIVLGNEFERAVKGFCKNTLANKDIDLETRWASYLAVEKFLPIDPYSYGFIDKLSWQSPYDDLGMDRYQTRSFSQVWEMIQENLADMINYEETDTYFDQYRKLTAEQMNDWREAVLASGFGGFTNDW